MHIPINLASQPFRRDRPIIVAASLAGIALVCLLITMISLDVMERGQKADVRRAIAALEKQRAALAGEQSRWEAVLRKPENAAVLDRTLFVNALLYRKGISWTKIFEDLEKVLPYNVRLVSIRPQVNGQNQVALDMVVGSETPEPIIELFKNLESSPSFGAVYGHSSMPPSQTEPLYRYRVSVNYAQKL